MVPSKVKGEPAPTRSDVQNGQIGPVEMEFGGDVPTLGGLSFFEARILVLEVRARILLIRIQKQLIDAVVDVVVMARVRLGAPARVQIGRTPYDRAQPIDEMEPLVAR